MLHKIAAVLSPVMIGTLSAATFPSRVGSITSARAAATILRGLPGHFSWFAHGALSIAGRAIEALVHGALAPASAAISLLAAIYRVAFATATGVIHVVPIYMSHWV